MSNKSPSRQARTERRALERQRRKLEKQRPKPNEGYYEHLDRLEREMRRNMGSLDTTKWLGQVRHPDTGQIINIPRVVPEPGSLWRCDLFGAKFLVQEVRGNYVHGMGWPSKNQINNIVERFQKSPFMMRCADATKEKFDFIERLSRDLQRGMNDRPPGPAKCVLMDFCGLDLMLEQSLQKIVEVLAGDGDYEGHYHFRPIS